MFSIGRGRVRSCEGLSRRRWLQVGALGAAGLTLPALLRARERAGGVAGSFYHALGVDPQTEVHDRLGRPWTLSAGRVVESLF